MEDNNTREPHAQMSTSSSINSKSDNNRELQRKKVVSDGKERIGSKTKNHEISRDDGKKPKIEKRVVGKNDVQSSRTPKNRSNGSSSTSTVRQNFDAVVSKLNHYQKRFSGQSYARSCVELMDWVVFSDDDDDAVNGDKNISSIIHPTRIKVFRFFFFIVFAFDIAFNNNRANMYDATLIDIPHFNVFRYLPPVSPERVTILWSLQSYIALLVAFGLHLRWHIPLLALLNTYTYFCSRIDSYQHHYLLWWILVILSTVNWDKKKLKAWPFRLVLVQLSFVYFFAGITKLDYLFRVQEVIPMQMNMWWLHRIVYNISAFIGFPNDHFVWWLAGLGVVLLEFTIPFAIHTDNEIVKTTAWVCGMIFHILANMSSLHIRMFSYYMFALYIIIAPDIIVRISNIGIPSTIRSIIVGFLKGVIYVITSPEDEDDGDDKIEEYGEKEEEEEEEEDKIIINTQKNQLLTEEEEEKEKEKGEKGGEEEPILKPNWRIHKPPPERRRPEKAGWCMRLSFFLVFSLMCLIQLGPPPFRFFTWIFLVWLTLKRPRQVTRIRQSIFGHKKENRYPMWLSVIVFMLVANWAYFLLQTMNFPYHDHVALFSTILWIYTSIRTPHSRTYYSVAHLCHCYILTVTYYGK